MAASNAKLSPWLHARLSGDGSALDVARLLQAVKVDGVCGAESEGNGGKVSINNPVFLNLAETLGEGLAVSAECLAPTRWRPPLAFEAEAKVQVAAEAGPLLTTPPPVQSSAEATDLPERWRNVPGTATAHLPLWSRVGSGLLRRAPPEDAAEVVEHGVMAMAALRAMVRIVPLEQTALASPPFTGVRALGRPRRARELSTAHSGALRFPMPGLPPSRRLEGAGAVFPSRDRMRPIERTQSAECAQAVTEAERLTLRQNILMDALQDMRDLGAWSDAEAVAVHNTLVTAAVSTSGRITRGLALSMPLPVCLNWAAAADLLLNACPCRACTASGAAPS